MYDRLSFKVSKCIMEKAKENERKKNKRYRKRKEFRDEEKKDFQLG